MSLAAMKAVFDYSATRNGARLVMLALADVADDEGVVVYADYSLGDIAAKCNLSERQVTTIVAALEGGELAVERGTGRGNTHQYKILLPGLEQAPHRRRKGEKTSPFPKPAESPPEKGEVSALKGEVSSEKGEVFSGPLRKDHSTIYQSPLPPSAPSPAACLPDGQAAGATAGAAPGGETRDPGNAADPGSRLPPPQPAAAPGASDPPTERFRRAVYTAFGARWFGAWFEEAAVTAPDPGADPGELLIETGSALRADRLRDQHGGALARLWQAVNGGPLPRLRTRVCPAMQAAMEQRREQERERAGALASRQDGARGGEARGRRRLAGAG